MLRFTFVVCGVVWLALSVAHAQRPRRIDVRPLNPRLAAWAPADFDLPPTLNTFEITELSPNVVLDEVGGDTRGHVERAEQFLENEQWSAAVDMLMRLTEAHGAKLIRSRRATATQYPTFVTVTQYVNECLASLPETSRPALQQYRQRVDPLSKQWFEQGIRNRDADLLRRIVEEVFNSSYGDDSLLALGELSLEAGQYGRARRFWQAIHPGLQRSDHAARLPPWLRIARRADVNSLGSDLLSRKPLPHAFPDSDIPIPAVWARLTLTSILEGNNGRAAGELQIMRQLWPQARGTIAGRDANYAVTLGQLLKNSQQWPFAKPRDDWTSFAGGVTRNLAADKKVEIPLRPAWSTPLSLVPSAEKQLARMYNLPIERAGETADRPCSHFPIVAGQLVLIQEEHRLRCLDLATGKPAWSGHDDGVFFVHEPLPAARVMAFVPIDPRGTPRLGPRRFTLSAHHDTLVATLGSYHGVGGSGHSALVGFDLRAEGALRFGPVETENANWMFHGAPVCDDIWCWVGLRNRDVTSQDYLACYDMRMGRQVWQTRICSADTIGHDLIEETTHPLLTLYEDTIYFNTNLGAIVALGAFDGAVRWLTKYPRTGPRRDNLLDEPWYALRDLTPCLYHEGMIIAAPSDCEQIFALDANSGNLIWRTDVANDATQLLGVGHDHLIVSGRRLWWIDVFTGQLSRRVTVNPFPAGEFARPVGFGRGLLAGGNIYWPTEDDGAMIHVLSQHTGRPVRQPIDLAAAGVGAGNLLLTKTHLLIATPENLHAFRRVTTTNPSP